ncbi:hypothetical protein Cantr_08625 [Candida viswanathii]|uniref:Uncharacterized protein n=1 Tax=Candida viswanathii TaxID=5486 RepID=A0A367Y536_9ASCO|nr:hypothetical protein Cantr_08625 [Candida viswanathii]
MIAHKSRGHQDHLDPIKPNLIFSSNIRHKIYSLIHNGAINNGDDKRWSVTINIQLNNLVSRHGSIKLSDLEDLINIHANKHYILRILKNEQWEYTPYEEIFIVMVKLIILKFTQEGDIQFEEDENYLILKQCQFLGEIEEYMRRVYNKYAREKLHADKQANTDCDASDSTLECSEAEDNGEYEGKYLEPLKSNDTLIDEFRRRFSDLSDEEKTFQRNLDFINNISNLRHNDGDDIGLLKNGHNEVSPKEKQTPQMGNEEYNPFRLDDLAEVDCENEDDFDLKGSPSPYYPLPTSPVKRDFSEDDEIIKISRQLSFQSPSKAKRTQSLSRMSSLSMIGDDRFGLDYAFNSDSSNVPSFIKDNKKFKFIKVGKVQKFVNLFEEQQQKEQDGLTSAPPSSRASRKSSRAGSPGKF